MLGVLILVVSAVLCAWFVRRAWESPLRPVLEWLLWFAVALTGSIALLRVSRPLGVLFGYVAETLLLGVPALYAWRWWSRRRARGGAR